MKTNLILLMTTLLILPLNFAHGQTQCKGHTKPLNGCMYTFTDLSQEQEKIEALGEKVDLKKNLEDLFREVNGKQLSYTHILAGEYTLKFEMGKKDIKITYNGRPARDAEICFQFCPGAKKVQWSNKDNGAFKKISNGLKIGKYEFRIKD